MTIKELKICFAILELYRKDGTLSDDEYFKASDMLLDKYNAQKMDFFQTASKWI